MGESQCFETDLDEPKMSCQYLMVKIISYWNNLPGDVPGPLWSEISKLRLDAFQKKVLWLSCHSLGFVQEHEIPWPVLDMRSDQLKDGQFLYAAPRPMFCSLGHHRVLFLQCRTSQKGPGMACDTRTSAHRTGAVLTSQPPHH